MVNPPATLIRSRLPKVLFLHAGHPDYLAASMFHGLRTLLGANCVDVPRFDCMYSPLTPPMRLKCAGHGFTLYGLLQDIPELADERFFWYMNVEAFDLFVLCLTAHWPHFGAGEILQNLSSVLPAEKLVILDGHDVPAFFPYAWRVLRRNPCYLFNGLSKHLYFKREMIGEGMCFGLHSIPLAFRKWLPLPENARTTAFSIPESKITMVEPYKKQKDFPLHIVDGEVASRLGAFAGTASGRTGWVFDIEKDYYADLRLSRFGITTKRAGWDCLRHYEMAANGCVLCFRDLDEKPATCAPHGLDHTNCITYHDYDDLERQVSAITDSAYATLLRSSYAWIHRNTTETRANELLLASGIKQRTAGGGNNCGYHDV